VQGGMMMLSVMIIFIEWIEISALDDLAG